MTHRLTFVVLLLFSVLAGVFSACQSAPPRFPHMAHLSAKCGGPGEHDCLTCSSCHGRMQQADINSPPWARNCNSCHSNGIELMSRSLKFARIASQRVDRILFPHDRHLIQKKIHGQCIVCHGGVVDPKATSVRSPPMSVCLDCHQQDFERGFCTPCHIREELSRLVPQTFLRHDAVWLDRHGIAAARQSPICGACHSATWCSDCHDQRRGLPIEQRRPDSIEREFKHLGDFLVRHPIEARSRPATCLRCHTPDSCDSCHISRGVSALRVGAVNPHPVGWMSRDTGSPDFHGRAARRAIVTCMGCHDHGPATNCIPCHRVGGTGGNPHPSGWERRTSRSTTDAMCRYCHVN
jgi:hypothetical protein